MDPIEEFARLKDDIRRLEDRAAVLRDGFLKPGVRLRSNSHEVIVKRQKRRVFVKDRLPDTVLADPRYWDERENEVVFLRALGPADDDIVLIE